MRWLKYVVPYAHIYNPVVSDEPPERHVDTFQCGVFYVERQASGVGISAVGHGQLTVDFLHEFPCRIFLVGYAVMTGKVGQCAVAGIYGSQSAQKMLKITIPISKLCSSNGKIALPSAF